MQGTSVPVELVSDPHIFLAAPVGRCLVGEHILAWYRDPGLTVMVIWGLVTDPDVTCMLAMMEARCRKDARPHLALIDFRRMEQVEPAHFERVFSFYEANRERLVEIIERRAVLRPKGFVGAAIEGYFALLSQTCHNRIFTEMSEALAWLGLPVSDPLPRELQALEERARSTPILVEEFRSHLRRSPQAVTLDGAARALGVSARTLQRQLKEARVSFRSELHLARVLRAQELLRSTDLKLLAIAHEVGVKKPQHLSALFRRLTGESPAGFRSRYRSAPDVSSWGEPD